MIFFSGHRFLKNLWPFVFFWLCSLSVFAGSPLSVLVYHHIEDPVTSEVSCTPAQFSAQMEALIRRGFTPLSLEQSRHFLVGGLSTIAKPVLITFDDGYESLYEFALPVAQRLKIPMTVFVVTSRLGLKPQFTRYLSAPQIKEMADSGWFDFGTHTHDLHLNFLTLFSRFHSHPNPALKLLADDLAVSKACLEGITNRPVFALAWPYGKYNLDTMRVARTIGFALHFTSQNGVNEPGVNPFGVKRIPVTSRDTPETVIKKAGN